MFHKRKYGYKPIDIDYYINILSSEKKGILSWKPDR